MGTLMEDEFGTRGPAVSALDILVTFSQRDEDKTVTVSHPDLPGVRFVALIPRDGAEMSALAKKAAAKEKCSVEDLSLDIIARWQLAAAVQRIEVGSGDDWQPVEVDGDIVTFVSPELKARLHATGAADAVWRLIKDDGVIRALVAQLVEKSNFGSQADAEDPTPAH